MNKAQFEIMGVAILVAIITFGGLIYFMLSQNEREDNVVKEYSNTEFAQGFIEVLLKTTADNCKGYAVNDLLKDCATNKAITCGPDGTGTASCEKTREVATAALDNTLKRYNKKYKFEVAMTTPIIIESPQYSCVEKERPGRQPLPNNVLLTLEICG